MPNARRLSDRLLALGMVAAGALCAGAPAGAQVVNADALAPFLAAASRQRVDIVGLGDSNQIYGANGWDHGWLRASALRFGMYATGLLSAGEGDGLGSGMGYRYQGFSTSGSGQFAYSGAPAFFDAILAPDVEMNPHRYARASGNPSGTAFNLGFFIEPACPIDVNAPLRFHAVYGVFGPASLGGGTGASFTPMVRLQEPPYSTLVVSPTLQSAGAVDGLGFASLDLPGANRNAHLNYRFALWGEPLAPPFILYYMRAENLDRARGASFSTLYGFGGRSAQDMASALQRTDDSYLSLFFGRARALQGASPKVLVRINTGLNDRNEQAQSVGPNPQLPGNGAGAFGDNLQAIVDRIRAVWALNQWAPEELFFLFTVSHPVSDPDDAQLVSYRAAADAVAMANPRCASLHLNELTTAAEMLANNWYQQGGFDRNHLTLAAFEELARRELHALRPIVCWADLDADGDVDFVDLNTLLSFFGSASSGPGAPTLHKGDTDGDGDVDFTDLNALLGTFGQTCPANLD